MRLECQLFNEILFSVRDNPERPGLVIAKLRKMYTVLGDYRATVGSGDADRNLDAVLRFLGHLARDVVLG